MFHGHSVEIMKTNRNSDPERTEPGAPFIAAHLFIKAVGISHTTLWRWCKAGRFNPVNINGRKYLDQAEVARFCTLRNAFSAAAASVTMSFYCKLLKLRGVYPKQSPSNLGGFLLCPWTSIDCQFTMRTGQRRCASTSDSGDFSCALF